MSRLFTVLKDRLRDALAPRASVASVPAEHSQALHRIQGQLAETTARLEVVLGRLGALEALARRPRAVYLGEETVLTELHNGLRIYVDPLDIGIAAHLMWGGRWETHVEDRLAPLVQPGMTVCDIGANFGYYTLVLGLRAGPTGELHAFEANPRLAALLRASTAVNGLHAWCRVHEVAVADQPGEASFTVERRFSGGGTVGDYSRPGTELIRVKTAPIDTILSETVQPHVIKMDIEGGEARAILGGQRTFFNPRLGTLLTEYSPAAIAHVMPPAAFLAQFTARGFQMLVLDPNRAEPVSAETLAAWPAHSTPYVLFTRDVPA
jgi:FkbM family methyltransferase